jgi:hypothetical protein
VLNQQAWDDLKLVNGHWLKKINNNHHWDTLAD